MYFAVGVAPARHEPEPMLPPIPAFIGLTTPDEPTATERLDAVFPRYIHEPPKGL
jgi:hypothetical protein